MKTHILTAKTDGHFAFQISVDVPMKDRNTGYRIMTAGCEAALAGFGNAKSYSLAKIANIGGTMQYKYQGTLVDIEVKVVK